MADTLAHEQAMVRTIIDTLDDDGRFTVYGTRDANKRVGTVSINIAGYEATDVASILDDSFDTAVRSGLHCAPYCHKAIGTFPGGAVRISPGPFNTDDEVAALLEALRQIAG
jgi:selenocysteine lyase/cysteine desulfurase